MERLATEKDSDFPDTVEGAWVAIQSLRIANKREKQRADQAEKRATYDPLLTTMLNQAAIEARVRERIEAGQVVGAFFIDIDNFKGYNDTVGHRAANELLRLIETLFNEYFTRASDDVVKLEAGRWGGDEFLLVMAELVTSSKYPGDPRSTDPREQMNNIFLMLRQVEQELYEREPRAKEVGVGFSIGGALHDPNQPLSPERLIDLADKGMFAQKKAKQKGRSSR